MLQCLWMCSSLGMNIAEYPGESSLEAKYMALSDASNEVIYLRQIIKFIYDFWGKI
jgi:hypothetical protein